MKQLRTLGSQHHRELPSGRDSTDWSFQRFHSVFIQKCYALPLSVADTKTYAICMNDQDSNQVRAVIFDWAGTIIDFGSCAPIDAFKAAFASLDFPITDAEARQPMGRAKRDHIATVLQIPSVRKRWSDAGLGSVDDDLIDRIYEAFLPLQTETVRDRSVPIEGAVQTTALLRSRRIKIGSSTGYTRAIMDVVQPLAREQGLVVDTVLTASDDCPGRPQPWMIYRNCERLGVYPMRNVVKVDDTLVGIEAAINAGCWAVGVVGSGNLMGLPRDEYDSLGTDDRKDKQIAIEQELLAAGAHLTVETVADLGPALDVIEAAMKEGRSPTDKKH